MAPPVKRKPQPLSPDVLIMTPIKAAAPVKKVAKKEPATPPSRSNGVNRFARITNTAATLLSNAERTMKRRANTTVPQVAGGPLGSVAAAVMHMASQVVCRCISLPTISPAAGANSRWRSKSHKETSALIVLSVPLRPTSSSALELNHHGMTMPTSAQIEATKTRAVPAWLITLMTCLVSSSSLLIGFGNGLSDILLLARLKPVMAQALCQDT
mmetsp:Transcript_81367/g.143608  ORF Transcript_81367/g.143608 Transcript_81367/m.143608 type:complete len:213 (+) Transcript_81367:1394-2032(+)